MLQYPPIQIVDEEDKPLRGAGLLEAYENGLLHRVVLVIIKDKQGQMVLQQRSSNVMTDANKWDVSAAGTVDEGENYHQAALRELKEELGIEGIDVQQVDKFYVEEDVDHLKSLKRFIVVFEGVVDAGIPITAEPNEVSAIRWMDIGAVKRMVAEQPDQFAHGLHIAVKYL